MKRVALIVALTGCNAIFGLDETTTYDARPFYLDAMVDAPAVCAAPSVTPVFDRELHQAVYSDATCNAFQTSAIEIALATCYDVTYKQRVYESRVGPITDMLPARGDINADGSYIYSFALAPEGNEMLVSRYDTTTMLYGVWRYERDATGAWMRKEQVPITSSGTVVTISGMTRGPHRHSLVRTSANNEIHEWAIDDTGTWQDIATYLVSDFGTSFVAGLDLSADGLRLLLYVYDSATSNYSIVYSYREHIEDRFGAPVPIPSAPKADLFMTEDCDRAYLATAGVIFFVRRLP